MLKFDWNFLFVIINLLIFFVLMKKFIFGKIIETMDKRKELIQKQFDEADECKNEAEKLKGDYQAQLEGVEEEKKRLLIEARSNAKNEYNKIVDRAQSDADRIKAEAKRAADLETEKAKRASKEKIAALAMETAAKVIGEKTSAETDSELYDKFLNESSDEND